MSSPGGGELSLFACPGVGNRPPSANKIANPWGMPGGGGWLQVELNHALGRNIYFYVIFMCNQMVTSEIRK